MRFRKAFGALRHGFRQEGKEAQVRLFETAMRLSPVVGSALGLLERCRRQPEFGRLFGVERHRENFEFERRKPNTGPRIQPDGAALVVYYHSSTKATSLADNETKGSVGEPANGRTMGSAFLASAIRSNGR
jgi:hypothetical protein